MGERVLCKPLFVTRRNKSVWGRFALAEDSSACLLGRDLLQGLDMEICLSPQMMDLIIMGVSVITESINKESYRVQNTRDIKISAHC